MAIKVSGTTVIDGSRNIVNVGNVDGRDISVDGTKLDGIEAGADVTDATNVEAAGAVMDADIGVTVQAYSAVLAGTTASFTTADETKLGGIEAGADVTDAGNVDPLVDTHLNTGTASSGEVLSWTGSDYDWIESGGAFSVIGTNNVAALTTLPSLTTGEGNFAVGSSTTAGSLSTGFNNVAIGVGALSSISSRSGNIAIGGFALGSTTYGNDNIAIGFSALQNFGGFSGLNVAIGKSAMINGSGTDNVVIGTSGGQNISSGNNNIMIGDTTNLLTSGASNEIVLGNNSSSRFRIPGLNINWTSANVPGAFPTGGNVGSYAFLGELSSNTSLRTFGSTADGYFLKPASSMTNTGSPTYSSSSQSGTWRLLGEYQSVSSNNDYPVSLWFRIA